MKKRIVAGLDYSMSGPAMTIHTGNTWSFKNCKLYTLTSVKKYHSTYLNGQILCKDMRKFVYNEERFDFISNFFIDKLCAVNCKDLAIEDYAFGAKGAAFTIGENTGVMKHKAFHKNIDLYTYAPTAVKKFATGKGNAKKDQMHDAFFQETSIDLTKVFDYTKTSIGSPIADLVDSYYVCKYMFNQVYQ